MITWHLVCPPHLLLQVRAVLWVTAASLTEVWYTGSGLSPRWQTAAIRTNIFAGETAWGHPLIDIPTAAHPWRTACWTMATKDRHTTKEGRRSHNGNYLHGIDRCDSQLQSPPRKLSRGNRGHIVWTPELCDGDHLSPLQIYKKPFKQSLRSVFLQVSSVTVWSLLHSQLAHASKTTNLPYWLPPVGCDLLTSLIF